MRPFLGQNNLHAPDFDTLERLSRTVDTEGQIAVIACVCRYENTQSIKMRSARGPLTDFELRQCIPHPFLFCAEYAGGCSPC